VPTVSAFVGSVLHDFQARDDVHQNTAVAVLESFPRYDPAQPFVARALGSRGIRCACTRALVPATGTPSAPTLSTLP
jgi:hypothetical protein